ncbi:MAG: Rieske 2Fe-2S domain-containing protein [Beijerinckiaceae bacterium]|nr:Rieske 2Fe-2S domain-containing protein [Beijerinckiaceae bacterium]
MSRSAAVTKQHLHETAATTLMGRLLRTFWQPIALASDVAVRQARPLRILAEDLTLYRGESGKPYLIGGRCAHRCTLLHTGIIREDQISCMYHGWRYDGSGLCIDIPAESKPRANPIRIAGYPVREYAGLIFAYMGEGAAPEFDLPRKAAFEAGSRSFFPKREFWDCNWFQQVENSMDAVHLSFAHLWGVPGQFGASISAGGEIPALEYAETSSGIRQIATRSNGNVRISDWTFPNNNHIVVPGPDKKASWGHVSVWAVPVDDRRTMRFRIYSTDKVDEETAARIRADLAFEPTRCADALFNGDLSGLSEQSIISAQDYVAVRGQGEICDREEENLSSSDAGVIFLRRVFLRELEAIATGAEPKMWASLKENIDLPPPPTRAA